MTSIAYAADAVPAGPGALVQFLPIILIFVVFYFLLIRPQQKKAKEQQAFLDNLKKGDVVISRGGLQGTVRGLTDLIVTLEIADKVRVKVARSYIQATISSMTASPVKVESKAGK